MSCCMLCLGAGWVEEDSYRNKRCPECSSPNRIFTWFNETEDTISLTKSNKGGISGLLISQEGDTFSATGKNEECVLRILKDMSEGNYNR